MSAGPGAATLRLRRRSPRPSPLAPDICTGNHSRRCDATFLRATFNVQPSNLQPLALRAVRPCPRTGAAALHPYIAARRTPLPSHLTPVRATIQDGAMQRFYRRRSMFNLPTFNPSRPSPLASPLSPHCITAPGGRSTAPGAAGELAQARAALQMPAHRRAAACRRTYTIRPQSSGCHGSCHRKNSTGCHRR